MLPIKFRLNLTKCLGGDVVWRISRWRASWTLEQTILNNSEFPGELTIEGLQKAAVAATVDIVSKCFSNSESPCHPNAYHQVLAQSDLPFGSRWGLIFKMATCGPSQISDQDNFSNSESLCLSDASNQVWTQSPLWFGRRCLLKNFKMAPWQPSWCWNETNLAVLNLHVSPMPPTKFQLNLTCRSRANVVSRFSSWPPWRQSWILEWY